MISSTLNKTENDRETSKLCKFTLETYLLYNSHKSGFTIKSVKKYGNLQAVKNN